MKPALGAQFGMDIVIEHGCEEFGYNPAWQPIHADCRSFTIPLYLPSRMAGIKLENSAIKIPRD